jgi:hypothetical protein
MPTVIARVAMLAALSACVCPVAALAGQYKTLNTETLNPGQELRVTSSPKNTGQAMEIEVYEWQTTPALSGTYRCNIRANNTGRQLILRHFGVNGQLLSTCTATNGATCSTLAIALFGNLKFLCMVSTQNNSPVLGVIPSYQMSVSRH